MSITPQALNALANNYIATPIDDENRKGIFFELYQSAYEYLYRYAKVETMGLDRVDVINTLVEKHLELWILRYNPERGAFSHYIASYARLASRNVFRDSKNIPTKVYDRYHKVKKLVDQGMPFEDACQLELYNVGETATVVTQVKELFIQNLDPEPLCLDEVVEILGGTQQAVALPTSLVYEEPSFRVDRSPIREAIDDMPESYSSILRQVYKSRGMNLHELDFGRKMRLADKLMTLDKAFRFAAAYV